MPTLRFRLVFSVLMLAAIACNLGGGPAATVAVPTVAATASASATATAALTATPTNAPATATATPGLSASTAIPSPTPSFDAASAIRVTGAPAAACPPASPPPAPVPEFINFSTDFRTGAAVEQVETSALAYLNSFGPLPIAQALQAAGKVDNADYFFRDVTNDGVPELAFAVRELFIFGCEGGAYRTLLTVEAALALAAPTIAAVQDMNLNGVPEIVVSQYSCGLNNDCLEVSLFEWFGTGFDALIEARGGLNFAPMSGRMLANPIPQARLFDTELNGTLELIVYGGIPQDPEEYILNGPWREVADVYMWNGDRFNFARRTYTSPEFRFQAVQDGDSEAAFGRFAEAEAFYRSVRDNTALLPWSPDLALEWQELTRAQITGIIPPTPATPATPIGPDPNEFDQLVAYSQFRLVVLYAKSGRISQADAELQNMLQTIDFGTPGYPYMQMAAQFWTGFAANAQIGEGCRLAVEFAAANRGILGVLGSEFHGVQSLIYTPKDVCPFG